MSRIVSVVHHPIKPVVPGKIAEEEYSGWHFLTALALRRYGSFKVVAARPNAENAWVSRSVHGVPVVLAPSLKIPAVRGYWGEVYVSPSLVGLVGYYVERLGYTPYIHEYRALHSEPVIRRVIDYPMILQHHGLPPPAPGSAWGDPVRSLKSALKMEREALLKKVKGVFFVLHKVEKAYLESLGVDAEVRVRTMGVDFNELKPPDTTERDALKEKWGLPSDSVVLRTYVGVFGEELSPIKGAHLIARLWRDLRSQASNPGRLRLVVTGVGKRYAELLGKLGIMAYTRLPRESYLELLKLTDVYFLAPTAGYYGGVGVAVMEALALGNPVVTPTVNEYPEVVRVLGIRVPYVRSGEDYKAYLASLVYVVDNIDSFKQSRIREVARKYFSWESFVEDFGNALRKLG